jgi:CelD/BcsL family acetyltransferase involved in cellulose biosynthesis
VANDLGGAIAQAGPMNATVQMARAAHTEATDVMLADIAAPWATLAAGCDGATLFAGPQFQLALRAAFGVTGHGIAAYQGGDLAGLLPFCALPAMRSLREAGFVRNAHTLRNHLLTNDPVAIAAILRVWRDTVLADTLLLENLPQSDMLANQITMAARALGLRADAATPGRVLQYADIAAGYDGYIATRSGQFRRQLRKRLRELEQVGDFRMDRLTGDALLGALPDWRGVVARSWQGQDAEAANTPADWALHAGLVTCGALWLARLDGRPVAALRMLEDTRATYVHTMHFDQSLRDHAPGLVLFDAMMQDACTRGLPRVDFNGSSPFFARWATGAAAHMSLRLYRGSLRGRGAQVARGVLRRVKAKPAPLS